MKATPIPIKWNDNLPIFSCESFLKGVGDEYGWLGGIDESGELRCILPYTIVQKTFLRMVRFRVETIPVAGNLSIDDEKEFLNSAIEYFRTIGAGIIIPASTNTIFRTYPDGSEAAPYGSYIIELSQDEEMLWSNIKRILRQNINTAKKKGVIIKSGIEYLDETYRLVKETFKRSDLPFMKYPVFKKFIMGLGENGRIMVAEHKGIGQSYCVFAFSRYSAYAIYAGNMVNMISGSNKLLYWEAIRYFKNIGVRYFDFVGARINPKKGSKHESINAIKRRFGASLKEGYMWKYSINPLMYKLYCIAAKFRSGGDIVDAERHKMQM